MAKKSRSTPFTISLSSTLTPPKGRLLYQKQIKTLLHKSNEANNLRILEAAIIRPQ